MKHRTHNPDRACSIYSHNKWIFVIIYINKEMCKNVFYRAVGRGKGVSWLLLRRWGPPKPYVLTVHGKKISKCGKQKEVRLGK